MSNHTVHNYTTPVVELLHLSWLCQQTSGSDTQSIIKTNFLTLITVHFLLYTATRLTRERGSSFFLPCIRVWNWTEETSDVTAGHLSKHHDDTVGVQEARGVSLIQSHLCLHRCPGAAAEVTLLRLRAGSLWINEVYIHQRSSRVTHIFLFSHLWIFYSCISSGHCVICLVFVFLWGFLFLLMFGLLFASFCCLLKHTVPCSVTT